MVLKAAQPGDAAVCCGAGEVTQPRTGHAGTLHQVCVTKLHPASQRNFTGLPEEQ